MTAVVSSPAKVTANVTVSAKVMAAWMGESYHTQDRWSFDMIIQYVHDNAQYMVPTHNLLKTWMNMTPPTTPTTVYSIGGHYGRIGCMNWNRNLKSVTTSSSSV